VYWRISVADRNPSLEAPGPVQADNAASGRHVPVVASSAQRARRRWGAGGFLYAILRTFVESRPENAAAMSEDMLMLLSEVMRTDCARKSTLNALWAECERRSVPQQTAR
jgi:hypothetical protein